MNDVGALILHIVIQNHILAIGNMFKLWAKDWTILMKRNLLLHAASIAVLVLIIWNTRAVMAATARVEGAPAQNIMETVTFTNVA